MAARHNRTEIVDLQIAAGADVNLKESNGMTALMISAFEGNLETTSLLIDAGASLDTQVVDGESALILCII
jgi:uncharacterized protein